MLITPAFAQGSLFGGADSSGMITSLLPLILIVVIMYFLVAYELWPQLARSAPLPAAWIRLQLWLWFVGMLVLSLPWHWVGLLGQPRRMAYFDYRHPAIEPLNQTGDQIAVDGV